MFTLTDVSRHWPRPWTPIGSPSSSREGQEEGDWAWRWRGRETQENEATAETGESSPVLKVGGTGGEHQAYRLVRTRRSEDEHHVRADSDHENLLQKLMGGWTGSGAQQQQHQQEQQYQEQQQQQQEELQATSSYNYTMQPPYNIAWALDGGGNANFLDYYNGNSLSSSSSSNVVNGASVPSSSQRSTPWSGLNLSDFQEQLDLGDSREQTLPKEMLFTDDSLVSVIAYTVLFVIAAFGNMTVFVTLFRNRHRKSRVNLFIMHLSVADLIVTFIMLPIEIGWHLTVSWKAGDVGCRLFMFLRAFGFYLSSFVLIAISLDRYFAILHPLSLTDAGKRGKIMLFFSWLFSAIASTPQSVIFHQEEHPHYPWFKQCVTFNFFPSPAHELAYNLFNIITVYGLPLIVIVIAYSLILWEMSKKTRESRDQVYISGVIQPNQSTSMRRSGVGRIERAKTRTLKMTIVIVLVFIMCWTPYFVISAWWWFDRESASKLDTKVQRGLFIFAVSNSCMDPIVYGIFAINFVKEFKRCCCFRRRRIPQSQISRRIPSVVQDPRNGCAPVEENELSSGRAPSQTGSVCSQSQQRSRTFLPNRAPLLTEAEEPVDVVENSDGIVLTRKPTPPHIAGTYRSVVDNMQYARL